MKPPAQVILDAETTDEEKRERLIALGLPPTVHNAILLGLSEKAVDGNPSAAKSFRDMAEEERARDAPAAFPDLTALTDGELRALAEKLKSERGGAAG